MVFSKGIQYNGKAQAVTTIDDNFKKTFSSVANWIVDKNYFKNNIKTGYRWVYYPRWVFWGGEWRIIWTWVRQKVSYYDPEKISREGYLLAYGLNFCMTSGELNAGSNEAKFISKVLEQVLGVEVFNNALTIQDVPLDKYLDSERFLRLLSRIFNIAQLILTPGNYGDEGDEGLSAFYINHYTGTKGKAGILEDGYVSQSEDGYVYFTKDIYDSGAKAKSRLSMKNKPTGFFIFNEDEMGGFFEPPRKVKPAFGENGGGIEIRHKGDAYYDSWRWIPIK